MLPSYSNTTTTTKTATNYANGTMKTSTPQQPHDSEDSSLLLSPPTPRRMRTHIELCEVIGDPHLQGTPAPMEDLFGIIDLTGGSVAFAYCGARCVTGCFDTLSLSPPCSSGRTCTEGVEKDDRDGMAAAVVVRHGDVVRSVGRLLHVGTRSMVTEVELFVLGVGVGIGVQNGREVGGSQDRRLMRALITFVTKTDKPLPPLPSLHGDAVNGEDEKQMDLDLGLDITRMKRQRNLLLQPTNRSGTPTSIATAPDVTTTTTTTTTIPSASPAPSKSLTSTPQPLVAYNPVLRATELMTRQCFLPKDLNSGGAVFGGKIVTSLANAATACAARAFGIGLKPGAHTAGSMGRVRLVQIKALSFVQAVSVMGLFSTSAVVVARRGDVACVFVRGFVERCEVNAGEAGAGDGGDGNESYFYHQRMTRTLSHSGLFFVRIMTLPVSERSAEEVDMDMRENGNGVKATEGSGARGDRMNGMDEDSFDELFHRAMSVCEASNFETE